MFLFSQFSLICVERINKYMKIKSTLNNIFLSCIYPIITLLSVLCFKTVGAGHGDNGGEELRRWKEANRIQLKVQVLSWNPDSVICHVALGKSLKLSELHSPHLWKENNNPWLLGWSWWLNYIMGVRVWKWEKLPVCRRQQRNISWVNKWMKDPEKKYTIESLFKEVQFKKFSCYAYYLLGL